MPHLYMFKPQNSDTTFLLYLDFHEKKRDNITAISLFFGNLLPVIQALHLVELVLDQ